MREINLTRGKVAIVDDEDYEFLNQWKWHAHTKGYPCRRLPNKKWVKMHDVVWCKYHHSIDENITVDHINRMPEDCRQENLRTATKSQQQMNHARYRNNSSGYKGVSYHKLASKFSATIQKDYKQYNLGLFTDKIEAARAYNKKAKELYGDFAVLNDVE